MAKAWSIAELRVAHNCVLVRACLPYQLMFASIRDVIEFSNEAVGN
jgi:hypothetical protein